MPKQEWQSFFDPVAEEPCAATINDHLPRQAPREDGKYLFGAGTVIPMKRRTAVFADQDAEKTAGVPSPSDTQRMTDQIGRQLRGMYDGILNQPVPDRFAELMKQLEHSERDEGKGQ